jgi:hypothetical protein
MARPWVGRSRAHRACSKKALDKRMDVIAENFEPAYGTGPLRSSGRRWYVRRALARD